MENAQIYADIIIEDDLSRIVSEEPITHEQSFIVRKYEFDDGAVVRYEWRGFPGPDSKDSFNHKFTLVTPPNPNPDGIKPGVIKAIRFSR